MCAIDKLLAEAGKVMSEFPTITDPQELCTAVSEELSFRHNCDEACGASWGFQMKLLNLCKVYLAKEEGCARDCTTCATAQMGCFAPALASAPAGIHLH